MKKHSLNKIAISALLISGLAAPAALAVEVPQVPIAPQETKVNNSGVSTEPMKVVKVKATKKKATAKATKKKATAKATKKKVAAKKATKKRVRRSLVRK